MEVKARLLLPKVQVILAVTPWEVPSECRLWEFSDFMVWVPTELLQCLQSHGDRSLSVFAGGPHLVRQLSWMCHTHQVKSSSGAPGPAPNSSGLDTMNQSSWKLQMVRLPSSLQQSWGWLPKITGFLWQGDPVPTLGQSWTSELWPRMGLCHEESAKQSKPLEVDRPRFASWLCHLLGMTSSPLTSKPQFPHQ